MTELVNRKGESVGEDVTTCGAVNGAIQDILHNSYDGFNFFFFKTREGGGLREPII